MATQPLRMESGASNDATLGLTATPLSSEIFDLDRVSSALALELLKWRAQREFLDAAAARDVCTEDALDDALQQRLAAMAAESGFSEDALRALATADPSTASRLLLRAAEGNMSLLTRFASSLSFRNVLWFWAVLMIVGSLVGLLLLFLTPLIAAVSEPVLKALCWLFAAGFIAGGLTAARGTTAGVFTTFVGLTSIEPVWMFTFRSGAFANDGWTDLWLYSPDMIVLNFLLVAANAAAALAHRSRLLGFLACSALQAAVLLLVSATFPALRDPEYLYPCAASATAVLVVYVVHVTCKAWAEQSGLPLVVHSVEIAPAAFALFDDGLFLFGPFGFLCTWLYYGGTCTSNYLNCPPRWCVFRGVVLCASCAAAAFAHRAFPQLKRLQQLSGTFLALFALVKYFDVLVNYDAPDYAWSLIGLGAGVLAFGIAWISRFAADYFIIHI